MRIQTCLIFTVILIIQTVKCEKPNIVLIIADDVGRNDISIHGSAQIPTPNIDALGYNGVILNRHYTMHICTPSRAALLTGNYPIRAGMQGSPIAAGEPRALPIWMPTIAEKISKLGYSTHLIGKWHLGHMNRSVTPPGRGFDTFFGYWNGFVGYFDYRIFENDVRLGRFDGLDLHNNHEPAFNYTGIYATDLFTKEAVRLIKSISNQKPFFLIINHLAGHTGKNGTALETPNVNMVLEKYKYINDHKRRIYADIVNRLDKSVGKVVKALSRKQLLNNTIIVFMSDNGAKTIGYYQNHGSNWPLRGLKNTLYEGGIRNIAVVWSKHLKNKNHIENSLFHITDWMPTLYAAAGGNITDLGKIDGINQCSLFTYDNQSRTSRPDILLNIDENTGHEAILSSDGRYKLVKIQSKQDILDNYYGDSGRTHNDPKYNVNAVINSKVNKAIVKADTNATKLTKQIIIQLRKALEVNQSNVRRKNLTCTSCLFDLINDPTETTDLSNVKPEIVAKLEITLNQYRTELMPARNKPVDFNANPKYCYDTYFTWLDPEIKCFRK